MGVVGGVVGGGWYTSKHKTVEDGGGGDRQDNLIKLAGCMMLKGSADIPVHPIQL